VKLRIGAGEARAAQRDPTLLCCAYNRQRLYLFSRREPEDTEDAAAGRCAPAQIPTMISLAQQETLSAPLWTGSYRSKAAQTLASAKGRRCCHAKYALTVVSCRPERTLISDQTLRSLERGNWCFVSLIGSWMRDRDVFNEKPATDELVAAEGGETGSSAVLPRGAVVHTTRGDIWIKLFPDECPKTVENFTTHARNGYYDGVIVHRVIKGFMIQTGDPLGAC